MLVEAPILMKRRGEDPAVPSAEDLPLAVSRLGVVYDRAPALWNVDWTAPASGLVAVVGPNGAGKSTLLKAILGLVRRDSGTVKVFGRDVDAMRQSIAYVPQRSTVDWDFPASALDVVAMGLYGQIGWFGRVRGHHRERAMACLEQVGMADLAHRQIGALSGGQQQRVFLARALAQDATIYLMDEPFAGVDAATEGAILETLDTLRAAHKLVVVVHHDLQTVRRDFTDVLVLNRTVISAGPMSLAFTEGVLQRAYGGRLAAPELRAAMAAG